MSAYPTADLALLAAIVDSPYRVARLVDIYESTAGGVIPAALSQESGATTPVTGERLLRRQPDPT